MNADCRTSSPMNKRPKPLCVCVTEQERAEVEGLKGLREWGDITNWVILRRLEEQEYSIERQPVPVITLRITREISRANKNRIFNYDEMEVKNRELWMTKEHWIIDVSHRTCWGRRLRLSARRSNTAETTVANSLESRRFIFAFKFSLAMSTQQQNNHYISYAQSKAWSQNEEACLLATCVN